MKHFLIPFVLLLLISSCKKDSLDGTQSVFVGEWKWVSTEYVIHYPWEPWDTTYYSPSTVDDNYYLEFKKKGKLIFENNNDSRKKRIVMAHYSTLGYYPDYNYFVMFLNNDHEQIFEGLVKSDTLIVFHNPVLNYEVSDTTSSTSYFVRN